MHERAAETHAEAAALYERLGLHDKVGAELEKAQRERDEAVVDHEIAAREGRAERLQ